jgi:hypothetical protein
VASSISGASVTYAQGGKSGGTNTSAPAANTGNGGGAQASGVAGQSGGSGVVVIRYLTP